MKINTIRRFDLWIGRPVCWGITFIHKIGQFFYRERPPLTPRKILFIKLFGFGSIVLAMPTVAAVRRKYPQSQVFFLTFKGNETILLLTELIPPENIHTVRKDTLRNFIKDVLRCFFSLVREKIDVVIDLEFFARSTAILSFLIRPKYRVGFYGFHTEGLKRGSFINFPISYNHTLHISRAFFTLLRPLHIYQEDFSPILPMLKPAEHLKERVSRLIQQANPSCPLQSLRKWIVVNPNTSDLIELRKWPGGYFVELADRLLREFNDLGVIFIGSKSESAYVKSLCSSLHTINGTNRAVDLSGMTTIADLIDLFHFSNLLVTNDSGPAHLASLTNIASIVLFGPETPALYSPLSDRATCIYLGLDCQPCVSVYNGKHSYCHDNVCLQRISPEIIFQKAAELL